MTIGSVQGVDAVLGELGVRAEIAGQVLGRKRLALGAKVELAIPFQFDPGFVLDEGKLLLRFDADFFLFVGRRGHGLDPVGELRGFAGNQIVP